jgi:2-amino-4-hydroxy-6-hydroxymethyldihydropteridine diphosphokinase
VIKQDTSENQVKSIYLGIGSNLGNKKKNIEKAKFELMQRNITILQSSRFYQSLSWPNPNNPNYLNIVIKISTSLKPLELLIKCKEIEFKLGRKKSVKNSPRECDIDVIDYDQITAKGNIILPHPRMRTRNFVLLPLFEIDKDWIHPVKKDHIKRLIFLLSNRDISSIKQI